MAGIVRNHPFVDGNKRAGFVVGVPFLELNGYRFAASEPDATNMVLKLAAGTLDDPALVDWLKTNAKRQGTRRH
jgi:death-on-curing protein